MRRYAGYDRWTYNNLLGLLLEAVGVHDRKEWDRDELDAYLRANIDFIPSVASVRKEHIPTRPDWAEKMWQFTYHAAALKLTTALRRFLDCHEGKHDHTPRTCKFPKFHSRWGRHERFEPCDTHNEKLRIEGRRIELPGIGKVRMRESLREVCWPKRVVVKRRGKRWFVSVQYENGKTLPEPGTQEGPVNGVDVGLHTLAYCSDGRRFLNPRPLQRALGQLRRVDQAIARSRKLNPDYTSKRLLKLYEERRRLHERVADIRKDVHRYVASAIAKTAGVVVVESLTLGGLLKNRNLARSLSDAGLGGLLAEIKWQCAKRGVKLIEAPRNFASTQICARCGGRPERRLSLSARIYRCGHCGWVADRDYNAALNLAALAAACPASIKNERVEADETCRPSDRREPVKRVPDRVDSNHQMSLWPATVWL